MTLLEAYNSRLKMYLADKLENEQTRQNFTPKDQGSIKRPVG
jgi:hypothetical protein